jgi:hypothetical protein
MHIFPPDSNTENFEFSNWAILEGSFFIKRLSGKKEFLRGITGLGSPLILKEGPYNFGRSMVLAEQVVNKGIVKDVVTIPEDGELVYNIYLNQDLEFDESYSVILLQNDIFKTIPAENLTQVNERVWSFRCSFNQNYLSFLLGIAYKGKKIGAFWENEREILKELIDDPDSLEFYLELIKWLHLPVLGGSFKTALTEIVKFYPGIVIKTWMSDAINQIDNIVIDGSDECWSAVLREFLFNVLTIKPNCQDIFDCLVNKRCLKAEYLQSVVKSFEELSKINPFLSCLVIKEVEMKPEEKKLVVYLLVNNLANVVNGFDDANYSGNEEDLLEQAAMNLGVDDNFLRQGVVRKCLDYFEKKTPLDENTSENLRLSLNVLPFSHYLSVKLLRKLV